MSDSNFKPILCKKGLHPLTGSRCVECQHEYRKQWRLINRDRLAEVDKAYRAANKEKIQQKGAAYKSENKEQIKESAAVYRAENRESIRQKSRVYSAANKDKQRVKDAVYYAKNSARIKARYTKEQIAKKNSTYYEANRSILLQNSSDWSKANRWSGRARKQNRRAKIKGVGGILSKGLAKKLFALQKGKCACCNLPLGMNYHLDHIMPLALNGQNIDTNMQLLRQRCNSQKKAKHPIDFMQSRGFLL